MHFTGFSLLVLDLRSKWWLKCLSYFHDTVTRFYTRLLESKWAVLHPAISMRLKQWTRYICSGVFHRFKRLVVSVNTKILKLFTKDSFQGLGFLMGILKLRPAWKVYSNWILSVLGSHLYKQALSHQTSYHSALISLIKGRNFITAGLLSRSRHHQLARRLSMRADLKSSQQHFYVQWSIL